MSAPSQGAALPLDLLTHPKMPRIGHAKRTGRDRVKPASWPLDGAVNVVLFAGMGGACQGLEEAGCPIHVANNHDPVALAAHAAMNPHTRHIKGDIFDVDPLVATQGRPVKVLWGSPDCRDHSVAKGGAPRSARVRSLPWQLCRWIGKTRPEVMMIENVREIRGWGPLIAKRDNTTGRVIKLDGTVAAPGERVPVQQQQLVRDKRALGRIFRQFVRHIQALGYRYEDRDLCCADYGVPTSRRRYFAVARRDGLPIIWPERTHAPRDKSAALGLLPWVAASTIIDWSLPLPSIFERKKPLAEATLRRIATGLKRYVIDNPTPFIVPVTHHGAARIYPVDETARTFTGAHRGEMALVAPHLTRYHGEKRTGEVRGVDMVDPLPTTTTENRFGLVEANLTRFSENSPGQDLAMPIDTMMAGATRFGLVATHIAEQRGRSIGQSPNDALGTQTQVPHHSIVAAHLTKFHNNSAGGSVADSTPTLTANGKSKGGKAGCGIPIGIVGATLVQAGYGERDGQQPRALDIDGSIGTQVAGAVKHAVIGASMVAAGPWRCVGCGEVFTDHYAGSEPRGPSLPQCPKCGEEHNLVPAAAWMVQHNLGATGHEAVEPLSTLTQVGTQQNVAVAYLGNLRGTGTALDITDALPAQMAGGNHIATVAAFLEKYYGTGGQHQDCRDSLDTLTTKARFGVVTVTIEGQPYVITDIGMRMLQPHEQAAAHELRLPDLITIDGKTRPLTKTEQTRLIGNSVPKRMAKLLAQCNVRHALDVPRQAAE
jgi:DNA (cytosine-5)-methyltransferase 1